MSEFSRPFQESDRDGFADMYRIAFRETIYYADESASSYAKSSARDIDRSLRLRTELSRIVERNREVIGAALVDETAIGFVLSPIVVHPGHQRTGIASALLHEVESAMFAAGIRQLFSHCHLGNPNSLAWHLRYGFRELPSASTVHHRGRFYLHELERLQKSSATADVVAQVERLASLWSNESERMYELELRDRNAARPEFLLMDRPPTKAGKN